MDEEINICLPFPTALASLEVLGIIPVKDTVIIRLNFLLLIQWHSGNLLAHLSKACWKNYPLTDF